MLEGFQEAGETFSREAHALFTAIFWEAPEKVIKNFLDLLPAHHELKLEWVLGGVRELR